MTPGLPGLVCGIQWLVLDALSWRSRGMRTCSLNCPVIHLVSLVLLRANGTTHWEFL